MNDQFRPVFRQKPLDMQAVPLPVLTHRDGWLLGDGE
jgi:hypothetical protein